VDAVEGHGFSLDWEELDDVDWERANVDHDHGSMHSARNRALSA
jgi:hypothetical protein